MQTQVVSGSNQSIHVPPQVTHLPFEARDPSLPKAAPPTVTTVIPELTPGEYEVERKFNREFRKFQYSVEEVIPTRSGVTLLVLDPKNELLSGYHPSCFEDEPPNSTIPHIGPIVRAMFQGLELEVGARVIFVAKEMRFHLVPAHGGRQTP